MAELDDRVALVTGSSSGIGRAIVRRLADAGARVVVNSVRSVEQGEAFAAELPDAIYVQADVADPEAARRLVERAAGQWGRLDVLVNNAGTTQRIPHADLDAVSAELFRHVLDVNVVGPWNVTQAAVPHLREDGGGQVVNISSLAGVRPTGSSVPYATSKAALNHLTRLLANVLGPEVRVNAIAPGLVATPWTEDWQDLHEAVRAMAPLRAVGTPEQIAEVCFGLVVSSYVTGEVIVADGGIHLR
jgi:ketoreductase RED2